LRDGKLHEWTRGGGGRGGVRVDGVGGAAAKFARRAALEGAVDVVGGEKHATVSVVVMETGAGEGDEFEAFVPVAKTRVVWGVRGRSERASTQDAGRIEDFGIDGGEERAIADGERPV